MKPIIINLSLYINIIRKTLLVAAVILVSTALGLTAVTTYDYVANQNLIREYQSRIGKLKKQAKNKEQKRLTEELEFLIPVIEKDLFPLPKLLTEIEKIKPAKINIHELIFSESMKTVTIKGESSYVESISTFLIGMEKSNRFSVKLIRQVIKKDWSIIFEVKAEWEEDEKN